MNNFMIPENLIIAVRKHSLNTNKRKESSGYIQSNICSFFTDYNIIFKDKNHVK